ncbi:MAG: MFS transporter [Halioglobus sp.]|nr:MFS transporter [Halioglobus sp.]
MFRIFLPPDGLEPADKKLLLLLGVAFFVGQYDMTILGLALPDIQNSFDISEQRLGKVIAIAKIGSIPALILALLSDRIGRRSMLMFTLLGLSIATGATGFARTTEEFIAAQFLARVFSTAEEIIAVVYVLELLPVIYRGWGVGFLAAMGGVGAGLASLLYGAVEFLPGGWRALYIMAALPILYLSWLRRLMPESTMFNRYAKSNETLLFWQPFVVVLSSHRGQMIAIGLIAAAFWFHVSATMNFMSKYLQEAHDYNPQEISLLYIVAGTLAIMGNVTAGRISDRIGRRPTLAAGLLINCLAVITFYNSSGLLLPLAWIALLFSFFAVEVMVNTISGELFPTSCRSTASTLRMIFAVVAGVSGLAIEGSLYTLFGSHSAALSIMTLTSLLAVPIVALVLRETSGTQLN